MKNTNIITTPNNTNTTNSKGVNNMKKTSRIKTRIIAGVLSAITVFTTGAIALTSASAAEKKVSSENWMKYIRHVCVRMTRIVYLSGDWNY